ncbi:MAG: carbohydrate kinase family protein [Treponema sp.]|jgi:sugar/nucleoside kinase (ribokinase family)|nr:carbohydrate kinase family protein [Treponema sp.]
MITIHGTGCGLIDFLYPRRDFTAPAFRSRLSREEGDGGLAIGKLVFAEDFERFAGKPYDEVLRELTGLTDAASLSAGTAGKAAAAGPSWNLGGPAVVSLVHAAQVLGGNARVSFYGVRGDDPAGNLVEEALKRAGFVPRDGEDGSPPASYVLKRRGGLTARTDVLSDPAYDNGHGERTFINLIGDAGRFGPEDLGPDFFDARIVTFGGTALTPRIHDSLTELLAGARRKKALTVVNLVYDYRSEQRAPGKKWKLGKDDDAYPFIDLLIADRDEGLKTSGRTDPEEALAWFLDRGCGAAVITEGSRLIRLAAGKGVFRPVKVSLPVSAAIDRELAAHPERRGDTTGCGDNFAGGLIAGLAEALALREAGGPGVAAPPPEASLDLREICVPGIVAGGFACFTLGGVFYEEERGEKRRLLAPFIEAYRRERAGSGGTPV